MSATKILWGQVFTVFLIVLAAIWAATQWTAAALAYQPQLGAPWFMLGDWPIYPPPAFFWWWFSFDAYAPEIFQTGAFIAVSGGFAAIVVAIGMSVWRARELKNAETYGSARWATRGEIAAAGLLGDDVAGSGRRFHLHLRSGAGAYICGEETALFNSIEGYRGEPRNKPPFPTTHGLFGEPTAINNVETLVNVLPVVLMGGEAYAAEGTERSPGTKLFCLSGRVNQPGTYEVEFGATLRDLIDLAGGLPDGRELRAVMLGGAAGSFVGPESLDMPLTLEDTRAAGASLGSGVIMVFDTDDDMVDTVRRIAEFFRDESCGQCVPCRVGTVRQEEVLLRLGRESTIDDERDLLDDLAMVMADASICGLGQTASGAVRSAIELSLLTGAGAGSTTEKGSGA